jgi:hypothetical protein
VARFMLPRACHARHRAEEAEKPGSAAVGPHGETRIRLREHTAKAA